MRHFRLLPFIFSACAMSLFVAPAAAQTAEEIINTALARYQASTAGIDNFTLVQETMGQATVLRYEKQTVDGQPVFLPAEGEGGASWGNFYGVYAPLATRARLEGEDVIDGEATFVLSIDDFSEVDFGTLGMPENGDFVPKKATLFLDTDEYLLRKVIMKGELTGTSMAGPFTVEAQMQDYRQVEGMWYPFRVLAVAQGIQSGMSSEDLEEAQAGMAEMQEQLAQIPASQRSMVEAMLKPKIEQLEKMLNSGTFEFTVQTKEVRVNE